MGSSVKSCWNNAIVFLALYKKADGYLRFLALLRIDASRELSSHLCACLAAIFALSIHELGSF